MKLRYLRAFIVLLAGLITLIVNMKMHRQVTLSLFIVLVVLIIFYVLGTLAVEIIQHSMEKEKRKNEMDHSFTEDDWDETEEEQEEEIPAEEEPHVSFDDDEV